MCVLAAWCAALLTSVTGASAETPGKLVVGAELDRGTTWYEGRTELMTGGGVRVGYALDLALVRLIPEGRMMLYGEPDVMYGDAELGGRVMFLKIVEPGLFARAVFPLGSSGPGTGFTAGGVLDVTPLPIDVGVHGGVIVGSRATAGVFGAHASVSF